MNTKNELEHNNEYNQQEISKRHEIQVEDKICRKYWQVGIFSSRQLTLKMDYYYNY